MATLLSKRFWTNQLSVLCDNGIIADGGHWTNSTIDYLGVSLVSHLRGTRALSVLSHVLTFFTRCWTWADHWKLDWFESAMAGNGHQDHQDLRARRAFPVHLLHIQRNHHCLLLCLRFLTSGQKTTLTSRVIRETTRGFSNPEGGFSNPKGGFQYAFSNVSWAVREATKVLPETT